MSTPIIQADWYVARLINNARWTYYTIDKDPTNMWAVIYGVKPFVVSTPPTKALYLPYMYNGVKISLGYARHR